MRFKRAWAVKFSPKFILGFASLLALASPAARAQTFPTPDYFRHIVFRPATPAQLPGPEGLKEFVADGKLRLSLSDAVRLTLLNNTEVRINQLQYEAARFAVARTYQPFDPQFTSSFSSTRVKSVPITQIEGSQSLSQQTNLSYSQAFFTGTRYSISFNASKFSTNSTFSTFNPSIATGLNFNLTQPLLRNRGLVPNRAPLVIARRNLQQSRATFEAQVNESIARAVNQYWAVVGARENLGVLRKSLELAEATYKQNKRALELGALPPLDIYRSESQVATRRVQVITAEYDLKQLEDELRRTVGADLDPYVGALDLELTESANPAGELVTLDARQAIELALQRRPELAAQRLQLANDDTNIRLAHNGVQPDLSFTSFYTSSGARQEFGDSFQQLGSFDFPTYGFSMQLRLPLKNRTAEADLGNALVNKKRSLYQQRQLEQGVTLEARNAVHQLEQAKLSIAASKIARDLAQKNLEAEQRKYELGAQTIFFVLDAQTQLSVAEQNLLQAQIGYQRAVTALDRATAGLLERHRVQISDPVK